MKYEILNSYFYYFSLLKGGDSSDATKIGHSTILVTTL